jgi:hypothetical protein
MPLGYFPKSVLHKVPTQLWIINAACSWSHYSGTHLQADMDFACRINHYRTCLHQRQVTQLLDAHATRAPRADHNSHLPSLREAASQQSTSLAPTMLQSIPKTQDLRQATNTQLCHSIPRSQAAAHGFPHIGPTHRISILASLLSAPLFLLACWP